MHRSLSLSVSMALLGFACEPLATMAQDIPPPPPFHDKLPAKPLPQVLDPARFEDPVVRRVYELAGLIRPVLFQQPCFCYCNRSAGHGSLLDCFTSAHGGGCIICQQEVLYCYSQKMKGKSSTEIRAGIMKGDWHDIEVEAALSITPPPAANKAPNTPRK